MDEETARHIQELDALTEEQRIERAYAPPCFEDNHDFQPPIGILGYTKPCRQEYEGGGYREVTVCMNCGCERVIDTEIPLRQYSAGKWWTHVKKLWAIPASGL